ncbi:MAG: ribosome-associated translation inhibitor RaiA [Patescibacteria group bacterium]|jgi:ribosomal subunit interface protein
MKIRIRATRLTLTPEIKKYIQEKMNMIDKYFGDIQVLNCDVEVGMTVGGQNSGQIYRAEVNLEVPGELLRVEKTEKEILKAIDKVKDHLEIIIKKYKEKKISKERR